MIFPLISRPRHFLGQLAHTLYIFRESGCKDGRQSIWYLREKAMSKTRTVLEVRRGYWTHIRVPACICEYNYKANCSNVFLCICDSLIRRVAIGRLVLLRSRVAATAFFLKWIHLLRQWNSFGSKVSSIHGLSLQKVYVYRHHELTDLKFRGPWNWLFSKWFPPLLLLRVQFGCFWTQGFGRLCFLGGWSLINCSGTWFFSSAHTSEGWKNR